MGMSDIAARVASYQCPIVEITGGEPLIQEGTRRLVHLLLEDGYEVLLETNGSRDISQIDDRCVRIVDIKCPSSGEEKRNDLENLTRLTNKDEVKFVIGDREDYVYARKLLDLMKADILAVIPVHFSPVDGKMDPKILAGWILQDHLRVRLHLQIHKIIWDPEKRGV